MAMIVFLFALNPIICKERKFKVPEHQKPRETNDLLWIIALSIVQ
jgi:hypothetical protein